MYRIPAWLKTIAICAYSGSLLLCVAVSHAGSISQAAAVDIGLREAMHRGYRSDRMEVDADELNAAWNTYLSTVQKVSEPFPEVKRQLGDRRFWAVYLSPRKEYPPRTGGD